MFKLHFPCKVLNSKDMLVPYRDRQWFRWQCRKTYVALTVNHKIYSLTWY